METEEGKGAHNQRISVNRYKYACEKPGGGGGGNSGQQAKGVRCCRLSGTHSVTKGYP
jgi:hypothetical protein